MVTFEDLIYALKVIATGPLDGFDHSSDLWDELNETREVARQTLSRAGIEIEED